MTIIKIKFIQLIFHIQFISIFMQAPQQMSHSLDRSALRSSNAFTKNFHSRIYESFHFQNLSQGKAYDSQYRNGYPKLYSFDHNVAPKTPNNIDQSKYSFRNSQAVEENETLKRNNVFLQSEVSRLEREKSSLVNRSELEILKNILSQRDSQILRLQEKISGLERQPNLWQSRYRESQNMVSQLNMSISSMQTTISQYESQIQQLNMRISQYEPQINQYNMKISQYESQIQQLNMRISELERSLQQTQNRPVPQDPQIGQLQQIIQNYSVQISQMREQMNQYELQITNLQQTNWSLEEKISRFESMGQPTQSVEDDRWVVEEGRLNLRIIILLEEINRLRHREVELESKAQELHAYLLKAENYIEQIQVQLEKNNLKENVPVHIVEKITRLENENSRYSILIEELNSKLRNIGNNGIPEEEHVAMLGERDLRIIILLEQINRLNHKNIQIRNHFAQAEDFIQKLQRDLQSQNTITTIPPQIQNQINYLSSENNRLNLLIQQYQTEINSLKITNNRWENTTNVQYNNDPEIQRELAKLQLKSIVLLEEINRLNFVNQEVNEYLIRAENYIQENEQRFKQQSPQIQTQIEYRVPDQIQQELARFTLKTIILHEQINRLNHAFNQIRSHLFNAQSYIQQCEIRLKQFEKTSNHEIREVFRVPPQLQTRLAFLAQENQRMSKLIVELENRPARIETRVEHKVQYQIPPEVETKISFLASENERLRSQSEHSSEGHIGQYGELQLRIIILLEEINRLNVLSNQLRGHLINAQNYIYDLENRPSNSVQSQQRHASQLNKLTITYEQQINHYKTQITQYVQQITNLKNQISHYKTQITQYVTQINHYKTQLQQNTQVKTVYQVPEEVQARIALLASENQRLTKMVSVSGKGVSEDEVFRTAVDWGKEHLRAIILIEEINRLNHKVTSIDGERNEVVSHLMAAEAYIQELENKYNQLEQNTKQSSVTNVTVGGSNSAIQELSAQITEIQNHSRSTLAQRDLRIMILSEEINRLNHKEREILNGGSSRISAGSSQEFQQLRVEKQNCQRQLGEVLNHLRQAEEYISELSRQNEDFSQERQHLISELNRLQSY